MKVLDLHCEHSHTFEGWFASEEDFVSQCARALVQCPVCGNATITKKLSAPRLNLGNVREDSTAQEPTSQAVAHLPAPAQLAALWMEMSRRIAAHTDDVGERFAEEARRMHYGETEERAIRGRTSVDQAQALVEEGIEVMPLLLPESLKNPLQ